MPVLRCCSRISFFLCVFWLCLPGAVAEDNLLRLFESDAVADATRDRGAEPPERSVDGPADAEIEARLQAIFAEIEALQRVDASVASGVVRLTGEVDNKADASKARRLAGQVAGVVDIEDQLAVSRDLTKRTLATGWRLLELARETLILLPLFLVAGAIWIGFWVLGRWASDRRGFYRRINPNPFIADLLGQLVRLALVVAGTVLALMLLDAQALIGTVLGAAGLIGLAIGFAIRDTVENYIASILLSLRNPFDVNDLVNIDGYEGNVARVTSRATILISADGNHIRIANAKVFKAVIINYSRVPERRFEFAVGIAVDQDLLAAQQLAQEIVAALPGVLQTPKPSAIIAELGDSTVVLRVFGWVNQQQAEFLKVRSAAIRALKEGFDNAGIGMPEPTYNLRMLDASTAPEPEAVSPQRPVAAADVSLDLSIEEQVRALQADSDEINLLQPDAPKEL